MGRKDSNKSKSSSSKKQKQKKDTKDNSSQKSLKTSPNNGDDYDVPVELELRDAQQPENTHSIPPDETETTSTKGEVTELPHVQELEIQPEEKAASLIEKGPEETLLIGPDVTPEVVDKDCKGKNTKRKTPKPSTLLQELTENLPASALPPDHHPFPVGAVITALHIIDGLEHFCDVIERAMIPSASSECSTNTKEKCIAEKPSTKDEGEKPGTATNESQQLPDSSQPPLKEEEEANRTESEKGKGESSKDSPKGIGIVSMVETNTNWRYYVHFHEFNRRMDTWLEPEQIIRAPNQAAAYLRELEREVLAAAGSFSEEDQRMKTRNHKRKCADEDVEEFTASHTQTHHDEEHHGLDEAALKEHEEVTKVKNVNTVFLGPHQMETWYFSPFPEEFVPANAPPIDALYFCQYTLRFFKHESELHRWQRRKNLMRHPPGNEIYRHNNIALFEVDGAHEKIYCENLCYLAKLFLDHKTLYYDTDCFLFYLLCEINECGYHPVGYFSKEKYSEAGYNLACILTFPAFQKRGYGKLLIEFSYELSKIEEKVGSPEKPLSDLGLVSYRSFWASQLLKCLSEYTEETISIMELSKITSIMTEDIVYTLQYLGILKYVGGAHILSMTPETLEDALQKYPIKEPNIVPSKIHWTPLITAELVKVGRDKFSIHSKKQKEDAELR